jgi:flagellar biosynthesis protein
MRKKSVRRAVALKYSETESSAPTVVAKGEEAIADKIIEQAKEAGVPLYKDDALVEVLAQIELDREIPPELYSAVAEIMSWIYRADKELR